MSLRLARSGGSTDAKPTPLIVKLARVGNKIELMQNKKKMRAMDKYVNAEKQAGEDPE